MKIDRYSKSSITGKEYIIPDQLDDINGIDKFLEANKSKKVIVVQGLGFVGSVMAIVCANSDYEDYAVIGVDLPTSQSYWKINSINEGIFPVISSDKNVEKFFKNSIKNNNFYATYDTYAYSKADFIIVDINLDVHKNDEHVTKDSKINFSVDLLPFKSAIKSIGEKCKEDSLILIETTVPPGSTKIAYEIVKECFHKRGIKLDKLKMGHSYERVMPGPNYIDSIKNFYRVFSGINDYSAQHVESFLKTIISTENYPLTRLKNTNATEISKVLENSYRAMNISFMVEWSRFAEEAGVDIYEVVNAIRMRPTHKNIMLPGIGVGGYCLTKDPLLASWSRKDLLGADLPLSMSERAVQINDNMPIFAFNFLNKVFKNNIEKKEIFLLGAAYAPDIGDTRYSPVELFYSILRNNNCKIYVHDPYISYWEELQVDIESDFRNLTSTLDAVVFTTGHNSYRNNDQLISILMNLKSLTIFDTIGILDEETINLLSSKHSVKVLGRGDI